MEKIRDIQTEEVSGVVEEVREIRYKISEECGHDLNKLIAYYQKVEKEMRKSGKYKFADSEPPAEKPTSTESDRGEAAD
jgi:hypothetical protein